MSSHLCSQPGLLHSIHDFVVAGVSNDLTEGHWSDFERLLRENDDAFQLYVEYVEDSDLLQAVMDATPDEDSSLSDLFVAEQQETDVPDSPAPTFPAVLPASLFPSTLGYSGWTISYLSATVITGLLILGFWLMPTSRPKQVARNAKPSVVEPKA